MLLYKVFVSLDAVRNFIKPMTGGLTHLLIPSPTDPEQWEMINEVPRMEQLLLQQSRTHFSQAHGKPYTVPPLTDIDKNHTGFRPDFRCDCCWCSQLDRLSFFRQVSVRLRPIPEAQTVIFPRFP